jgi:hypothetical protein
LPIALLKLASLHNLLFLLFTIGPLVIKIRVIVNTPVGGRPSLGASLPIFIVDPAGAADIERRIAKTHFFLKKFFFYL